jgi:two-component system cell cycle sensor histidine kinase/response regulator CckA
VNILTNRLLLRIALPVVIFGTVISILLPAVLFPKVSDIISSRTDALLVNANQNAIRICDERFNDLLDLRMESNLEMRKASLNQALEEIKGMPIGSPDINILVLDSDARVIGSTVSEPSPQLITLLDSEPKGSGIQLLSLQNQHYRILHSVFPFWRIHIFTLISQSAYLAPIILAKRIVYLATFGVLATVLLLLIMMFSLRVNRPLKTLIAATRTIQKDRPDKVAIEGAEDEIGQLARAFNTMVDKLVEDRLQILAMMREIRDSEEQYRILSEYSLTHIAMIQKGRLLFLNNTLAEAAGLPVGRLQGTVFDAVIDDRDRNTVMDRIAALESGRRQSDRFQCRLKNKEGVIWLDAIATLALFREANAVLFHAVDITENKGLEKKLSQAQKLEAIGVLAGGVAHDLNNILSGLLGYPELLLMDLAPESPLRQPLTQIEQSAHRAADIVQDLLTMARRSVEVKQVVGLNMVISEYLLSLEHAKIKEQHPEVLFKLDLEDDLLNMQGSAVHLSKTIMNLVRNAAESMPDGGDVLIKTRNHYNDKGRSKDAQDALPEGDYVVLVVSDSGTGLSGEDMEHIFEPFYTKKVMGHSGTGLGMSVVLGTVQDHGGKVDVSSRKGQGTQFTLYFPATRESHAAIDEHISFEAYKGNGQHILVVDDIEDQRILMTEMLSRLGYRVKAVESGEVAVDYLQQKPADLVVLDMVMDPGMDGLETLQEILKIVPGQKAIILSGFSETSKVEKALAMGAGDYLKKPVVMEKLGTAVRHQFDLDRA